MPEEKGGGTYKDGSGAWLGLKIVSGGEINPNTGFPYDYKLWIPGRREYNAHRKMAGFYGC